VIVDGTVGFVGGAGFADHWLTGDEEQPRWRDMMVRIEGDAVSGLEGVFAENWLESAGEILMSAAYFPFKAAAGNTTALVVSSSPTAGRSTQARILFQALVASAGRWIHINSPYFLPDDSLMAEIARAIRERNVEVKIVVPGKKIDHMVTRRSSRRKYGELLQAGARIYEYEPSMNHTKSLIIDGLWAVVGSTNMDSRSFGLNDEVNVALVDPEIARRLEQDFQRDLARSTEVNYEKWKGRKTRERIQEWIGALFERQQ
jgi:cardiolipin synthase